MTDTLDLLERAMRQMESAIAAIRPEETDLPTPCQKWTVRDLVEHVVGRDLRNFAVAARGDTVDWRAPGEPLQDDWAEQFRVGATRVLETWRVADLDAMVPVPGGEAPMRTRADQQITEFAVHSWDLVRATGEAVPLDAELAEHALAWSSGMLRPEHRGSDKAFAIDVPVLASAPAYDRLAGWFGRNPSWTGASHAV